MPKDPNLDQQGRYTDKPWKPTTPEKALYLAALAITAGLCIVYLIAGN